MAKGRILFVNQQIFPYNQNSVLANVGRFLPQGIQDKGREIRTFMPRFGSINERKNQLHEVIRLSGMNLIINNQDHQLIIKVASIPSARMQIYFIDNEDYFYRKMEVLDKNNVLFEDNDERTIFFARGVLETVKKLSWQPHIIHCSGWFASVLPFYVKRPYRDNPIFTSSKMVISLFDDDFPGSLNPSMEKKLKADGATPKDLRHYKEPTYVNIMKAAIDFSSGVVLFSEKVNPELIEYAKTQKKPIVEYCADEKIHLDKINELYASLIGKIED